MAFPPLHDPATFLYLNPSLQASGLAVTVEDAVALWDAGDPYIRSLPTALPMLPDDYDPLVYLSENRDSMDVSTLNGTIFAAQSNEGRDVATIRRQATYIGTIFRTASLTARNSFVFDDPKYTISACNLRLKDHVKIGVNSNDEHIYGSVTAVDTSTGAFTIASPNNRSYTDSNATYTVYGIRLYDPRRLSLVELAKSYNRAANARPTPAGSQDYRVPQLEREFDIDLYHVLYPDTRMMSQSEAYIDYTNNWGAGSYRITKAADLLNIRAPGIEYMGLTATDTLKVGVKMLVVDGPRRKLTLHGDMVTDTLEVGDANLTVDVEQVVVAGKFLAGAGALIVGTGAVSVTPPTRFLSSVSVAGQVQLLDALVVSGPTSMQGLTAAAGAVQVTDRAVMVTVPTEFQGPSSFAAAVSVGGALKLAQTLDVAGQTVIRDLSAATGAFLVTSDTVSVTVPTAIRSSLMCQTLSVSGSTVVEGLSAAGALRVTEDTVSVSVPAVFEGPLQVTKSIAVSGLTDVQELVAASGALHVTPRAVLITAPTSFHSHVTFSSSVYVPGEVDFGALQVTGLTSTKRLSAGDGALTVMDDSVLVAAPAVFGSNVSMVQGLDVAGSVLMGDSVSIRGSVSVQSDTSSDRIMVWSSIGIGASGLTPIASPSPIGILPPASLGDVPASVSTLVVGRSLVLGKGPWTFTETDGLESEGGGLTLHHPAFGGNTHVFDTSGRVGFNVSPTGTAGLPLQYGLVLNGDVFTTGSVISQSDRRFKADLRVIDSAMDRVARLTGYTYQALAHTDTHTNMQDACKRYTGLLAQDVREVLPEAVHADSDGMLSVAYGNLAGLFVEAIKELRDEVLELKRRLPQN